MPTPTDALPSARTLLRSTALAAAVAALLLVTVVLPAEYGVDPTGAGAVLGLTPMGRLKREQARAGASGGGAVDSAAALLARASGTVAATDTTRVTLGPGESREVKLVMRAGARTVYSWSTDRGTVGVDLHGDPVAGRARSYKSSAAAWSDQGTLTAAFDGLHGWYWQNTTDAPLTVTLRTAGDYLAVARLD